MDSTWETRDLPVLEAVVRSYDDNGKSVRVSAIAEETGMSADDVQRSLRAFCRADPEYFGDVDFRGDAFVSVTEPTERARREVGAWPSPEGMAERLIIALNDAADRENDPKTKGRLKKTAAYLGNAGRDVAIGIGASVLSKQMSGM